RHPSIQMTIVLGTLGHDIWASAEPDGWCVRPPAGASLVERDAWPSSAQGDPRVQAVALEIEQLLEMGLAQARDTGIVVAWEIFGEAIEAELTLPLRWTDGSPLMLAIDRASDVGYPDFEYR